MLGGERPERPTGSLELGLTDDVWDMIRACWEKQPQRRPLISEVVKILVKAVSKYRQLREAGPSMSTPHIQPPKGESMSQVAPSSFPNYHTALTHSSKQHTPDSHIDSWTIVPNHPYVQSSSGAINPSTSSSWSLVFCEAVPQQSTPNQKPSMMSKISKRVFRTKSKPKRGAPPI